MTRQEFIDRFRKTRTARPELTLLSVFLVAILCGAVLLHLPVALRGDAPRLPFLDSLFMSTSATCVTGLSTIDVPSRFSLFGQTVLLLLIQLGGVGIMTFAAFFLVVLGRQLTARSEALISQTIGGEENRSLRHLLSVTIGVSIGFELIGAAVFAARFHSLGRPWLPAIWHGLFHSVSSFCNAGITIEPAGVAPFRMDFAFMAATIVLVLSGSLGFVVLSEIGNSRLSSRGSRRLSLHTFIVLRTLLILCAVGFASFLAMEWNGALAALPAPEKLSVAAFQSLASRTSGFSVINQAATHPATRFSTLILFFIGGAPGSAAGGIKTTTTAILFLSMLSTIMGRRSTIVRARAIPQTVTAQAVASFMTMSFLVLAAICALLATECRPGGPTPTSLVFEAVSACSTTGLSLGATGSIAAPGKCALIVAMYLGRIGPLTAAFLVGRAGDSDSSLIRYPEEDVIVG